MLIYLLASIGGPVLAFMAGVRVGTVRARRRAAPPCCKPRSSLAVRIVRPRPKQPESERIDVGGGMQWITRPTGRTGTTIREPRWIR